MDLVKTASLQQWVCICNTLTRPVRLRDRRERLSTFVYGMCPFFCTVSWFWEIRCNILRKAMSNWSSLSS